MRLAALACPAVLLLTTMAAYADPVGTSVTGSLTFNGGTTNYFNPANGFVPTGYGNHAGTTVTIGSGVEFGFADGANTDTANFSSTGLTVTDVDTGSAAPFEMDFTDPAFTGFNLLTNNSGFSYSFSGDTLRVLYAGTLTSGTYSSTFSYAGGNSVTPEPSSIALLGTGLLGACGYLRRRRAC